MPGLNVVALISGGKDSFFSLLHCQANGHRVVALANLHPPASAAPDDDRRQDADGDESDLNSFMYQTVGHEVIPLYAQATGLPLYRREISGDAVQVGRDYAFGGAGDGGGDETESMVPLLRKVMARHPEVNAVCAGAILSTYQRTRVESVALRLGLVPLAYLWKFPILPVPDGQEADGAQLLRDMEVAGMEARIVKVASGGLDEDDLWEDVASAKGVERLKRAMKRFGCGDAAERGAVLGEGGEFETLVTDGPLGLFAKRIVVDDEHKRVVREGGGTAWLSLRKARVEDKTHGENGCKTHSENGSRQVRIPDLLDARFTSVLEHETDEHVPVTESIAPEICRKSVTRSGCPVRKWPTELRQWRVYGKQFHGPTYMEEEATSVIEEIKSRLRKASLSPVDIVSTTILLRHMSDFLTINKIYGSLFVRPNPPSRVTVSSLILSPQDCNIAVYVWVHHGLAPGQRQGLHVQSRSYWAPANIGPYSQAITVPMSTSSASAQESSQPLSIGLVHIAGQIPLIPATMELPDGPDTFKLQVVLSLQHLWRIGIETGVQWWSSAVAYLPFSEDRSWDRSKKKQAALIAARAWSAAHAWSEDKPDEDDEAGPDLWDRKHDPRYMSFVADDGGASRPKSLPDKSVLDGISHSQTPTPAFFAAEVGELPRGAAIEWHSHLGFAGVLEGIVSVVNIDWQGWEIQHTVMRTDDKGTFVHTVMSLKSRGVPWAKPDYGAQRAKFSELLHARGPALAGFGGELAVEDCSPSLVYVNTGHTSLSLVPSLEPSEGDVCPVIPCFSLWNARGEEVMVVAIYRTWLGTGRGGGEIL